MNSILTVCVGNICRSPMAEALLRTRLPDFHIESAGVSALIGHPADAMAVDLMRERGLDISDHRGRQIAAATCQRSDLILVMDNHQKKLIEVNYPLSRGKVFSLSTHGIADPYQRGRRAFEEALALIDAGVNKWVVQIEKISN